MGSKAHGNANRRKRSTRPSNKFFNASD